MEEKMKKSENMVFLPEPMIQHIQSFINKNEAARTSLLSKSWYDAWLTRPDLDFTLLPSTNIQKFQEFANKTFRRYRDSNRKIDSFALTVHVPASNSKIKPGVVDMVDNALNIGATHLKLDLKIPENPPFLLPLDPRNLDSLSLVNCRVEIDSSSSRSTMKSLSLKRVSVRGSRLDSLELHKLRHLFLESVEIQANFFTDSSSKFPCLKILSLVTCRIKESVVIASTSIEQIVYSPRCLSRNAEFEVPNIRKFSYTGVSLLPPLFLSIKAPASREWEFDVNMRLRSDELEASFLIILSRYFKRLTRVARISLSVQIEDGGIHEHEDPEEFFSERMPLHPVALQSLSTNLDEVCISCYHLLFRLFEAANIQGMWI